MSDNWIDRARLEGDVEETMDELSGHGPAAQLYTATELRQMLKEEHIAGFAAGQAAQRATDAAVCEKLADEYDADDKVAAWLVRTLNRAAAAILAANLPQSDTDQ